MICLLPDVFPSDATAEEMLAATRDQLPRYLVELIERLLDERQEALDAAEQELDQEKERASSLTDTVRGQRVVLEAIADHVATLQTPLPALDLQALDAHRNAWRGIDAAISTWSRSWRG